MVVLFFLQLPGRETAGDCRKEAYFGPTGGLAPRNFNRKFSLLQPDLISERTLSANMSAPLIDMIRRARRTIDIASYILDNRSDEYFELLAANRRGVRIRLFLDESIKDALTGKPIIEAMIEDIKREEPTIEVKVLDPEKAEEVTGIAFLTMHEKFGVFDGRDCYNGSANISRQATLIYHENRFFFRDCPEIAGVFSREFNRLWKMGRWRVGPVKKVAKDGY